MKTGTEDKKKLAILCVVGAIALGAAYYIYSELFDNGPAPAPAVAAAPAVTASGSGGDEREGAGGWARFLRGMRWAMRRRMLGTASTLLDPTLKMGPMLVTRGTGLFGQREEHLLADVGAGGGDSKGDRFGSTEGTGWAGVCGSDGAASRLRRST